MLCRSAFRLKRSQNCHRYWAEWLFWHIYCELWLLDAWLNIFLDSGRQVRIAPEHQFLLSLLVDFNDGFKPRNDRFLHRFGSILSCIDLLTVDFFIDVKL